MSTLCCANGLLHTGVGQVTYERILNASHEPQNWLTYSGDYKGWRYSALDQINASNVHHLAAQWVFQSASLGQFETTLWWLMHSLRHRQDNALSP